MGLDTSYTDLHPVKILADPVKEVAKNFADNVRQIKVSNNQRDVSFDSNRLEAFKTTSNNNLDAFKNVMNTKLNIVKELLSGVNTLIKAYAQIQNSREQTKQVQIKADAFVSAKREETRQVQIQEESKVVQEKEKNVRYLAELKRDLEIKQMELQKFELRLDCEQEKWRESFNTVSQDLDSIVKLPTNFGKNFAPQVMEMKHCGNFLIRLTKRLF